jgi:hypothetical protein
VSNYLEIAKKAKTAMADEPRSATSDEQREAATKATEAPMPHGVRREPIRDESDRSDKGSPSFTPLTVSEVLAEMNRWGSGAGKNAELYRRGELSEEKAVEYVTCAILTRRRQSFEVWRHHAPAVRKALGFCIHELEPEVCKVCSGHARRFIEGEGTA